MSTWLALLISFIWVSVALGLAEGLRKVFKYSPDFTRKFIHIAIGMWSIGTVYLFQNKWAAASLPALFVVLNYIAYKKDLFKALGSDDDSNLGTVYFPLAFFFIILVFWDWPDLVVAALMPLTWGDAMAAVLGRKYGHLTYTVFGHKRTVEGSISMAVFSLVSTFLALWLIPPPTMLLSSLGLALAVTIAATVAESVSPWGLDNLTIPGISTLILYIAFYI